MNYGNDDRMMRKATGRAPQSPVECKKRTRAVEEILARMDHPIEHIPTLTEEGLDLYGFQDAQEKDLISQALILAKGNKAEAARLLRLNRTTFVEKMRKYGFEMGEKKKRLVFE